MASLPVLQQIFVMLLVLLQSSLLLLAQQGAIELQSTQQINSPTPIKATPAPLLLSTTPIVKIARKVTPTPILLGLPSKIQTPLPLRMDRNIVSTTFLKTIAQLSPVPVLAQKILPTAAPILSQRIVPTLAPVLLQEIVPTAAPVLAQKILPTAAPILSQRILHTLAPVLLQEIVPTAAPVLAQKILPTAAPILSQRILPTLAPVLLQEIVPTAAPVLAQKILPTAAPILSQRILPTLAPVLLQEIVPTAAPILSQEILPTAASVLAQEILPTAAPVLSQEILPTASPLTATMTNNIALSQFIKNHPNTSMKGFVTFSFNNKVTHLKEVSSAIINPTPQSLTSQITNILFPQSDHIVSTISPILGNPQFGINTQFPLIGNFDTLELIKKMLNIEPTKIKPVETILDTLSLTKSHIFMSFTSPTQANQLTATLPAQSIFSHIGTSFPIEQSSIPILSRKVLSPGPTISVEKPVRSVGITPGRDNSSIFNSGGLNSIQTSPKALSNNQNIAQQLFQNISPQALSNNQNIAQQLFQNISSFPAPIYVTIILSPTIILASTNTSSTMQHSKLSTNSLHVLPSQIQSLKTFFTEINPNQDTNLLQHSGGTFGLMPSKLIIPTDVMTQKVLPTPTLPNTQGNLGGHFISDFKPFIVNTGNFTARIRPFKQGSDNPNNLSLLEAVNLIRNANPTNFNLPNSNGHSHFLKKINQHNNFKNQTLSPEFFSALPNKRIINLNQFSNNASISPAIIVSNPLIRNHASPITFNPAFSQVPNIQANPQLLHNINQQNRFPHLIQNSNPGSFNLPFVIPVGNNGISGHSSINKKTQADSNFLNNNLALRNPSTLPNKAIPSLGVFPNNSSRVPIIIVSKPNTNLQPFFIRNGNFTTLITPNPSFTQVPNLQTNPQLSQAVNRQAFSSPLIQNSNFSHLNLPFVFPPRNNKFQNQLSNLKIKNEHNNLVNQNVSLKNTSLVSNQTLPFVNVFRLKSGFTPRVSNSPSLKQNNTTLHNNLLPNGTHTLNPHSPLLPVHFPSVMNLLPNASATNNVFNRLQNLQQTIKNLQNNSRVNITLNP